MSGSTSNAQTNWIRKYSLVAYASTGSTGQGLQQTLSNVNSGFTTSPEANLNSQSGISIDSNRCKFSVTQSDYTWQNLLQVRVYNLSEATVNKFRNEFDKVTLQAGYANGPFAVVFSGTILQVRWGKESNVDTYVDVLVGDGDKALNFTVVNKTLAAGATPDDEVDSIHTAMQQNDSTIQAQAKKANIILPATGLPRGKVQYGISKDLFQSPAERQQVRYSIQQGVLVQSPIQGYLPGAAVVINSRNGMIGQPEQTEGGITVRTLLNPQIVLGQLVQINNSEINQTQAGVGQNPGNIPGSAPSGSFSNAFTYLAPTSADGYYKVFVHEMTGDSRGQEWYSDLTCLAVDLSASSNQSISVAG